MPRQQGTPYDIFYASGKRLYPTTNDQLGAPIPPGYPQSPRTYSAWMDMQSASAAPPAPQVFPVGGGYFVDAQGQFVGEPPPWATSQQAQQQRSQFVGPPATAKMSPADLAALPFATAPSGVTGTGGAVGGGGGAGGGGTGGGRKSNNGEIESLFAELSKRSKEALDMQKKGLSEQEAQMRAYADMPLQTDLSPLMALADTWYGGNLSKGYNAPQTAEARIGILSGLQQGLQRAKGGLSEAEIAALKDQIQGRIKLRELDLMEAEKALKRAQTKQADEATKSFKEQKLDMQAMGEFDKMYAPMFKQTEIIGESSRAIQRIVNEKGIDPFDQDLQSKVARLSTAYNQGFADLGALAGADLSLIERGTGLSNSLKGIIEGRIKGATPQTVSAMLTEFEKTIDQIYDSINRKQDIRWAGRTTPLFNEYRRSYEQRKSMGSGGAGVGSFNPDTATEEQLNQFLMGAH